MIRAHDMFHDGDSSAWLMIQGAQKVWMGGSCHVQLGSTIVVWKSRLLSTGLDFPGLVGLRSDQGPEDS